MFGPSDITAATGGIPPAGAAGRTFPGVSIDTRTIRPGDLFVAIRGRRFDSHNFVGEALSRGAGGAVVDRWPLKGMDAFPSAPVWKVPDTLRALGDLARFHRGRFPLDLVAITGSAGKTTTKAILSHLLSATRRVLATEGTQNNLIGVPLTLLKIKQDHNVAVLELGTNQWGEIRRLTEVACPTVGVITNIGQAHLETFGDLNGVLKAKGELWEAMSPEGTLILNADDPLLWEAGQRLSQRVVWFGCREEADIRASRVAIGAWGSRCLINDRWEFQIPLPGLHSLRNVLAALACARVLGEDLDPAIDRVASVPAVPGRLNLTYLDGCLVLDDSYNANPTSLKAALEVIREMECRGRRIAVIGDMLELGELGPDLHAQAGRWVAEAGVEILITVGSLSRFLLEAARGAGLPEGMSRGFDKPDEAREFLMGLIRPGDVVLLKGSRGMQMEQVLTCSTTSSIH